MGILRPSSSLVLADATVDLISRAQRPFLFRVRVTGKPPHAQMRVYDIAAKTEDLAAMEGIERFVRAMSHPFAILSAL
jgi:hypothetical protein